MAPKGKRLCTDSFALYVQLLVRLKGENERSMPIAQFIAFLAPYEWVPLITLACALPVLLWLRGLACGATPGFWRSLAFFLGIGLMYAVTQTRLDYFAQFVFFIHRGQHLVLHHLAAMLIVLANPLPVLAAGMPHKPRQLLGALWRSPPVSSLYRFLQYPPVAALLFVGLIYFWLIPSIHFTAMLSAFWYQVMNWSMAIDGILFWWLIFNPAPPGAPGSLSHGKRCLLLVAVAFPQIFLGAYIALFGDGLYTIYELCGRPWPISVETDQTLGGLITWIPGAMMSGLGVVLVLAQWSRQERGSQSGPVPSPNHQPMETQS